MTYRILVMAKAPIPGTVKTRLMLPPEVAAGLQEALIQDTAAKARSLAPTTVAGAPPDRSDLLRRLLPEDVDLIAQSPGDLGDRMLAAARTLFDASSDPLLLLGTDAPTLPPETIEGAASALASHDISIIPSPDGGYVLLGLRRPVEAVFHGVDWSTEAVFRQTLLGAEGAGLSVCEGEPWYDVDAPGDLARLGEELGAYPERAPRTAGFLRGL
ncbi:MAG TPA: TIGR04282 family arsenosugar biosynthesis glycosyltransferase [Rubrobacter sp.]|nr:TIGR04282 family arsenosugar biosynthesis glycosyltransferase [Rubrobacter sp.]